MAKNNKNVKIIEKGGAAGGFYCIGFFGAAVYFVDRVDGFGQVIWALLKAAVWPAYLVNEIFTLLQI